METVNQVDETVNQGEEKTFTQDQVNAIVGERLKSIRAKYADYDELKTKASRYDEIEEESKTELQRAKELAVSLQDQIDNMKKAETVRTIRESVAAQTGVPAALLTAENEEDCLEQANKILAFAKPSYPNVKDGGEVNLNMKKSTREQFADWIAAQGG